VSIRGNPLEFGNQTNEIYFVRAAIFLLFADLYK